MKNRKGFTLIEMLVVIAIIAVLVAIVVPTVSKASTRANAATDAGNLRSMHEIANSIIIGGTLSSSLTELQSKQVASSTYPDAKMYIAYSEPGFVNIYYVNEGKYYSIDYFSDVAINGESKLSTDKPAISNVTWFNVTDGVKVE